MTPNELIISRGDNETLRATIKRTGIIFDLTGCSAWFTAKKSISDSDNQAVIKKHSGLNGGITIPTPTNGQILIALVPSDTNALTMPTDLAEWEKESFLLPLYYDIQIKTTSNEIFTAAKSKLFVDFDVTQTTAIP